MTVSVDESCGKKLFTRSDTIEAKKNGRLLLIYDSKVYDVTSWAPKHPGGEVLITSMIGRDATDPIIANHPEWALKRINCFYAGDVVPDETINRPLSLAFRRLHEDMKKEGFYKGNVQFYVFLYLRLFAMLALSVLTLVYWGHTFLGCTIAALVMGAHWQQMAFLGHDTGHSSVSLSRKVDYTVGLFIGNFVTGISARWWKDTHHTHHLLPNDPVYDPDVQTLLMFEAIYSAVGTILRPFNSLRREVVQRLWPSFFVIMLVARPYLYISSFVHLIKIRTWMCLLEIVALIGFWTWFVALTTYFIPDNNHRLYFALLSHLITFLLHIQISLSHFAMSVGAFKEEEDFVHYQLRTTLDVDCPPLMDWFHGGLQFQTAHHFFPRMPRHHLRQATQRVLEFCKEHHLTFNIKNFTDSNILIMERLEQIARETIGEKTHDD